MNKSYSLSLIRSMSAALIAASVLIAPHGSYAAEPSFYTFSEKVQSPATGSFYLAVCSSATFNLKTNKTYKISDANVSVSGAAAPGSSYKYYICPNKKVVKYGDLSGCSETSTHVFNAIKEKTFKTSTSSGTASIAFCLATWALPIQIDINSLKVSCTNCGSVLF